MHAHQSKHILSADRQVEREREREREMRVFFFNFASFFVCFFTLGTQSLCRSLQKIWSYEMSIGFNS